MGKEIQRESASKSEQRLFKCCQYRRSSVGVGQTGALPPSFKNSIYMISNIELYLFKKKKY